MRATGEAESLELQLAAGHGISWNLTGEMWSATFRILEDGVDLSYLGVEHVRHPGHPLQPVVEAATQEFLIEHADEPKLALVLETGLPPLDKVNKMSIEEAIDIGWDCGVAGKAVTDLLPTSQFFRVDVIRAELGIAEQFAMVTERFGFDDAYIFFGLRELGAYSLARPDQGPTYLGYLREMLARFGGLAQVDMNFDELSRRYEKQFGRSLTDVIDNDRTAIECLATSVASIRRYQRQGPLLHIAEYVTGIRDDSAAERILSVARQRSTLVVYGLTHVEAQFQRILTRLAAS